MILLINLTLVLKDRILYIFRETGTDESDVEGDTEASDSQEPSIQDHLEALKLELMLKTQELENSKRETTAALEEARAVKAQAHKDLDEARKAAAQELAVYKFGLERFSTDNDSIKFYTGFTSYEHIKLFYELVKPTAQTMTYCYATGERPSRSGARNMLIIDELFMFLVRLRLGLFEQDLAHRFRIHISSISRKLTTWCNYLYFMLGCQPMWPSRENVNCYMPECFRTLYPTTRVIIDCTEIYMQTPSSLLLQSQLYSSYKSNTTLKGLVGITPYGAVSFVSTLYSGAISDKEITRCSGILDLLENGDSVMADKGFDVEDLLLRKGVQLNIPPFLKSQAQFSSKDVQQTKTIASLRIHVERAIRRIKEYHFFDSDVPLNALGSINQIYTVACLLTNFQGPLIANPDGSQQ